MHKTNAGFAEAPPTVVAEMAAMRRALVRLTALVEQRLPRTGAGGALPEMLTIEQVADLSGLSVHVVRKAQFETKLRRKSRCRKGYALADVLDWLDARGQCPEEYRGYLVAHRKARTG